MLADCQHVRQHLGRMVFIRQAVPDRDAGILRKLLNDVLSIAPVLNSVVHAAQNSRGVRDGLLLSDLGACRIQVGDMHAKVVCRNLKGASGSGAGLLKDQRDILSRMILMRDPRLLLLLQLLGAIEETKNLLRCKVLQCQKISAFQIHVRHLPYASVCYSFHLIANKTLPQGEGSIHSQTCTVRAGSRLRTRFCSDAQGQR